MSIRCKYGPRPLPGSRAGQTENPGSMQTRARQPEKATRADAGPGLMRFSAPGGPGTGVFQTNAAPRPTKGARAQNVARAARPLPQPGCAAGIGSIRRSARGCCGGRLACLLAALWLGICAAGCAQADDPPSAAGSQPVEAAAGYAEIVDHGFTPPEGFALQEDGVTYRAPDHPKDDSSIRLAVTVRDPYFDAYDSQLMARALENALQQQLGEPVAVTVEDFAYYTVDALPAWRLQVQYSYDGRLIRQLTVAVNAERRYAFTFTQVDTDTWQEAFAQSADSIWFLLA